MKNRFYMFAVVSLFSLALAASAATAGTPLQKSGLMGFNSFDLIGAPVKGSQGEVIGVISEVEIDSGGHVFAIVNHGDFETYGEGGRLTPVPFEALQIWEAEPETGRVAVMVNMDAQTLEAAPFLDPTQSLDRQFEARLYEHFGLQPYWEAIG